MRRLLPLLFLLCCCGVADVTVTVTVGQSVCHSYPCNTFAGVFYGLQTALHRSADLRSAAATRLLSLDDRNTAARTANNTRTLVSRGAFALLGDTATTTFSNDEKVLAFAPTFGLQGLRKPFRARTVNVRPSFHDELSAALAHAATDRGAARVGLLYQGDAAGQDVADMFLALRPKATADTHAIHLNMEVETVFDTFFSDPSLTAIIIALENPLALRFLRYAQTQRPELVLLVLSVADPLPLLAMLRGLNGTYTNVVFASGMPLPETGNGTVMWERFRSSLAFYYPAQKESLFAFEGFIAGSFFQAVVDAALAEKADASAPLTVDDVVDVLYRRGTWTVGDIVLGPYNLNGTECNKTRSAVCGCNQGLGTVWIYDVDNWKLRYTGRSYQTVNCGMPPVNTREIDLLLIIALIFTAIIAIAIAGVVISACIQRRIKGGNSSYLSLSQGHHLASAQGVPGPDGMPGGGGGDGDGSGGGGGGGDARFQPFFLACAKEVLETTQYISLLEAEELRNMELLGSGSTAKVYRATWRGVPVAVKQLHYPLELCMDTMIQELANEIKLWSQLVHPHIVQFLGVTKDLWLVMEFMEHGTLRGLIKDGKARSKPRIPLRARVALMRDTALAVGYLHSRHIIHRDLNPNNIMVTGVSGHLEAKLADFGLSRIDVANSLNKTASVGTPVYAAPEVLSKGDYSNKSDAYAFGLTLWFVLNEEEPFNFVSNPFELVRAVTIEKRRPEPALVPELRGLVERLWDESPETRPELEAVTSELQSFLDGDGTAPGASEPLSR